MADSEDDVMVQLQKEMQDIDDPQLDFGDLDGEFPVKSKYNKITYEEESSEEEEPAPKKKKKKVAGVDNIDALLAMSKAIGNLTKMVANLERDQKSRPEDLTVEERVAQKVAVKQFKNPCLEKQWACFAKIELMLKEQLSMDDPVEMHKKAREILKDVNGRTALLELADKHPRAFAIADAEEATKKMEEVSKSLSKDVRDSILNDNSGRKQRFRGAGASYGRPYTGAYYGRNTSTGFYGTQQRIPSLMEGINQQGPCFICQGPHLKKDCPRRRNQTRRMPY